MGTGEIGVPSLLWLLEESGHEIVGVFTQPDRPVGRSGTPLPPEVKVIAEAEGVPVFQPEKLRGDGAALEALRELGPDLIIVVAYGQILPRAVLEVPSIACINLHASLLPRHRGASPIQAAIRDGDSESGMTVMHISPKLDAGDMILAEPIPIRADDTGGTLHDRLAELGPPALKRAFPLLESGDAPREVQDESKVTHCGKLGREDGRIDWSCSAVEIERLIRAYHPWPGTHTYLPDGKMLKLFPPTQVVPVGAGCSAAVGEIRIEVGTTDGSRLSGPAFTVATGDGLLRFGGTGAVQLEGRKRVSVAEFLAGRGLSDGSVLA